MLCAQAQQSLEGGHGGVAAVVPEGELVQVDLQVLGRGAVVGAGDPGFEVGDRPVRPGQDQRAVGEPVMLVDRAVVVAGPGQLAVSAPPVCTIAPAAIVARTKASKVSRSAQEQWSALQNRSVPLNQVQEGDLIFSAGQGDGGTFSSPGHVAMMVSGNQLIQAPYTGADVEIVPYNPSAWQHAARPTGSGTMGTGPGGSGSSTNGGLGGFAGGSLSSTSEADNISAALGGMASGGMGGANSGTSGATNGTRSGPSGSAPINSVARLAKQMAARRGWTGSAWNDINSLEMRDRAGGRRPKRQTPS